MRGLITRGKAAITVISLITTTFFCIGQTSPVQVSKNQTFSTQFHDYEALGINPANIAANRKEGKRFSFGLMHNNILLYNRAIKYDLLHGGGIERLGDADHWIDDILVERTAITMDNTILGLNFHIRKAGSFALSVKNKVQLDTEVNGTFEDLEFDGTNFSNLMEVIMQTITENPDNLPAGDNSYAKLNVVNEFNLGYSRRVLNDKKVKLFAGVNIKYLMGFADLGLQFNAHEVSGYHALSSLIPEGFEGDNIISEVKSDKKFGHGVGGSLGVTMKMDKLTAGLSVLDIGMMKWPSTQIYITKEDVIQEALSDGQVETAIGNMLDEFQRSEDGREMLPTKLMLGASYAVHKYVHFYTDFATPLINAPYAMDNPTIGGGAWLSAKDVLTLKAGAALVSKKLVTLPMTVSFFGGKNKSFEISFGTTDLLAFFLENREYMQIETAWMKFHF